MAQHQEVVLKVGMHCEGCKKKVEKALKSMNGVYDYSVDLRNQKVTVEGTLDSRKMMGKLAKKSGKRVELWQWTSSSYNTQNWQQSAYAQHTQGGQFAVADFTHSSRQTNLNVFSDEDPNSCSISWNVFLKTSLSTRIIINHKLAIRPMLTTSHTLGNNFGSSYLFVTFANNLPYVTSVGQLCLGANHMPQNETQYIFL